MSEMDMRDRISAPLSCTNCRQNVRVSIDRHATGNLTIVCPRCKHEHYRYVENGVITEDRWRSSAFTITHQNYNVYAVYSTSTASNTGGFFCESWYNSDTNAGYR